MVCFAHQRYGWFDVPTGRMSLTEITVPPGYAFGWATVLVDLQPREATIDAAARTVTFATSSADNFAYVVIRLINITP